MCGAGLEQHYVELLEDEKQDLEIEQVLFASNNYAAISFNTFSIKVFNG
jgi:hypothetical protein